MSARSAAAAAVLAAGVAAGGCVAVTVAALAANAAPGTVRAALVTVTAGMALAVTVLAVTLLAVTVLVPGVLPGPAVVVGPGAEQADQQARIFVNLAWRMQSLVHRAIVTLDGLENEIEDPALLKGLYTVDHLVTQLRRQSESLAVLGGSASRRRWNRQVIMPEVLRAAVAEIEQYARVRVVPPVDGVLRGTAVADVIHLIAEILENATRFSPPHEVQVRAQAVPAGIAVEVEDRGLGMRPEDRDEMNALLADPGRIGVEDLLREGRIGLYVAGVLAGQHGIRVQLRASIFGGILAIIILPECLLEAGGSRVLPPGKPAGPARSQARHPDIRTAAQAPGLMADFLGGVGRSEAAGRSAGN